MRPLIATRLAVARAVRVGDTVIDATVGNGHDTELLARLVGPWGRVLGFDIQESAINAARLRLTTAGLSSRVELICAGHEVLHTVDSGDIRACMFNLGYLPGGGDKSLVTRADTTVAALRQVCSKLLRGGLVTVMVYPANEGGPEEALAVDAFCNKLCDSRYRVTQVRVTGRPYAAYAHHIHRRLL